jgi:ribonuclease-3
MSRSISSGSQEQARLRWARKTLHHEFSDSALLEQALTHRSASRSNNERLEFLGDSVLNFCVARLLYEAHPTADEGDLSRRRAALVNKRVLAAIGRSLDVDNQLILGSGELRSGGAQREAALADAVEALVGAVLLDADIATAADLIQRLIGSELESLPSAEELKDPKTRLQEWLQARGHGLPAYAVDSVAGSEHKRSFVVSCAVDSLGLSASGTGRSRRVAEQEAASSMLGMLQDV